MERIKALLGKLQDGISNYARHEVETRILLAFMEMDRQHRKEMKLAFEMYKNEEDFIKYHRAADKGE